MPTKTSRLFILTAIAAALAVTTLPAWSAGPDKRPAQVERGQAGRALFTLPAAAPTEVARGYLRTRGRSEDVLASLSAVRSRPGAHGITQVQFEQTVDGLPVYGAYFKGAVNARGELVHAIDRLAAVSTPQPARVNAATALQAAMARVHPNEAVSFRRIGTVDNVTTFDGGPFFHSAPTVSAVAIPMDDGSLARGWLVETWTAQKNLLHHTLVDGDGRVLNVEKRTANDSYNVYREDPLKGPQTFVSGSEADATASPDGWLGTGSQLSIHIAGNNVNAYLDVDHNNRPDRGGTAVADGNFLTAVDLTVSPSTTSNRAVAVQNLFYLNNFIHDLLYGYGFNEAAGNFQEDNFGRGGKGRDAVQAEAQDGSDVDNADFATPPDGRKPRMQMFLWTGADATHEVIVDLPVARNYGATGAAFGPALTTTGVAGNVSTTTPADGCTAISTALAGRLALIDRGICDFSVKALNAQTAGAAGVIIANNQATPIFTMGAGANAQRVRIPSVMISQSDGVDLKAIASAHAIERKKTLQPLQIDSSLDADIVFHEYGHGLSWRMIGGMSGPIARAIGEGTSDVIAMLINGDDKMGEYSGSNPNGIRRFPYAGYPLTYKAVTGAEEHDDGEIYAAIGWRMIELFTIAGRPVAVLFGYVVDGMNFTPVQPSFENMRDGILMSVRNGASPVVDCGLVWRAFAQFGVGVKSSAVINADGSVTATESFDQGTCP